MQHQAVTSGTESSHAVDPGYGDQFDEMALEVCERLGRNREPLFVVDSGDLWSVYLGSFPSGNERQFHNCNTCRDFIKNFGSLATIDGKGAIKSALWNEDAFTAEFPYRETVRRLRSAVEGGKIERMFLCSDESWGYRERGGFTHFFAHVKVSWKRVDINAEQAMAAKLEDFKHLKAALADLTLPLLRTAKAMLSAGSLSRPEKLMSMCDFLIGVRESIAKKRGKARDALLWAGVAKAADGWCTPRGSALGALVHDIADGVKAEEIIRRHNAKMDPLQYMRPSAPTSAGNVAWAEALFAKMGLASALRRRFALLSEVDTIWTPKERKNEKSDGVFGHLLPGKSEVSAARLNSSAVRMTFAKFRREVLPGAIKMYAKVPYSGSFCAYTTASNPDSAPILQWDREDNRYPVAWYLYAYGSSCETWGLKGSVFVPVLAISPVPSAHFDNDKATRMLFVLEGCKDKHGLSLGLFPECLKSELHAVRSTIEAHSSVTRLDPVEGVLASGLMVPDHSIEVRVVTKSGVAGYVIDRWD